MSGKPNISYHAELTAIKKEIDQHQAVVVHFDAIKWKHFPTKQEIQEEFHMQPVLHVWDGVVYADEDYAVVQDCFKDLHLSSVKVR